MSSKPHSKTVRGTLDNPKTKAAIQSDQSPPSLGDPTSLKPENGNKNLPSNDSAPPSGGSNNLGSKSLAPTVDNPTGELPHTTSRSSPSLAPTPSNPSGSLPHSKTVRGTLANTSSNTMNKTQLGDPASLKAETSNTKMDRSVEREGKDKGLKSKL